MPGVEQRNGLHLRWFDRSLGERSRVAPMLLQVLLMQRGAMRSPTVGRVEQWRCLVTEAVAAVGTPCYVTDWEPVRHAVEQLEQLGGCVPVQCWLSFKTHPLPQLAWQWARSGRGVEVVSEAELVTLLDRGVAVDQLLVNGVAKHRWLPRYPLRHLRVHFDSLQELDALLPLAIACEWRVGVRCHVPGEVDARNAGFGGQFGMSPREAVVAFRRLVLARADVQSVHFHLGQAEHDPDAYTHGVNHIQQICAVAGVEPLFVDVGGGLPTATDERCGLALNGLRSAISTTVERFPGLAAVWLENGRYITADSSVLAVRVLDVKEREEGRYFICDGGRTNHALAADVAPHPVLPLVDQPGARRLTTVCGPTCMTDDRLGRFALSERVSIGDVLIWFQAGAYHLPWETRFSQGLCPVVWHGADGRLTVARKRERACQQPWTDEGFL